MKHFPIPRFTFVLFFTLIAHSTLIAQKLTEEKLLGCWKIKSIEFLQANKDSAELTKNIKSIFTCFEKNGKFTTKLKNEVDVQIIGTGTFNISADGKTLTQKRGADDGGIDESAEVVMVSNEEVSFKILQMIFHFERIPGQ